MMGLGLSLDQKSILLIDTWIDIYIYACIIVVASSLVAAPHVLPSRCSDPTLAQYSSKEHFASGIVVFV